MKKDILRVDRIWTTISGWQTRRRHCDDTLIFKYVWFRHHVESKRKGVDTLFWQEESWEVSYELEGVILPVLRRRLGKNSCMRIDCVASTAEDSKQDLKCLKNADKDLSDIHSIRRHSAEIIVASRLTNYVMFDHKGSDAHGRVCHTKKRDTQKECTHTLCRRRVHILCCRMWIKHEINVPLQKLDWWQKKKNAKKKILQSSSPATMQTKQKNVQISRSRGMWIVKFIKDLNKMQSTEFYCPRRRSEFLQTALTPSSCTSPRWKNASWKFSIKVETRIVRKTTYASKGPEVTLRNILGREGFDVWCNSREAEIKNADVELWPNYIRESQLVERGITRTRSTCKRITQGQQSEWEGAAKKIHEAGNCESHKTKFKQLIADAYMRFQRSALSCNMTDGCTNALTQF